MVKKSKTKQRQKQKQSQKVIVNVGTGGSVGRGSGRGKSGSKPRGGPADKIRGPPSKQPLKPQELPRGPGGPVGPNFAIGPRSDPFIPREFKPQPTLSELVQSLRFAGQPAPPSSIEKEPKTYDNVPSKKGDKSEPTFDVPKSKGIKSAVDTILDPIKESSFGFLAQNPSIIRDAIPRVFGYERVVEPLLGTEPDPKKLVPVVPPIQAPSATLERTRPTENPFKFVDKSPVLSTLSPSENPRPTRDNFNPKKPSPLIPETETFVTLEYPPLFVNPFATFQLVPDYGIIPETTTLLTQSEITDYQPDADVFVDAESEEFPDLNEPIRVEPVITQGPTPEIPLPQEKPVESKSLVDVTQEEDDLEDEVPQVPPKVPPQIPAPGSGKKVGTKSYASIIKERYPGLLEGTEEYAQRLQELQDERAQVRQRNKTARELGQQFAQVRTKGGAEGGGLPGGSQALAQGVGAVQQKAQLPVEKPQFEDSSVKQLVDTSFQDLKYQARLGGLPNVDSYTSKEKLLTDMLKFGGEDETVARRQIQKLTPAQKFDTKKYLGDVISQIQEKQSVPKLTRPKSQESFFSP